MPFVNVIDLPAYQVASIRKNIKPNFTTISIPTPMINIYRTYGTEISPLDRVNISYDPNRAIIGIAKSTNGRFRFSNTSQQNFEIDIPNHIVNIETGQYEFIHKEYALSSVNLTKSNHDQELVRHIFKLDILMMKTRAPLPLTKDNFHAYFNNNK